MPYIWLITGCSSGFGREIALAAAQAGDTVVATARDASKLADLSTEAQGEGKIITRRLDVLAKDEEMKATIDEIVATVGRLDILVNNAGYVLEGAIEECSYEEVDAQFATNVFGQLNVLRAAVPHMRSQQQPAGGVIANLGSIGGWRGTPAAGVYCATKAAIAVYSQSLRAELAPFGIDVTCVEPGYFRTRLLTGANKTAARNRIPELDEATRATREAFARVSERQPGDPAKGARVLVDALTKRGRCRDMPPLPPRLALGSDAVHVIAGVLDESKRDLEAWRDIVSQTDCDDVAG
ncbi:putative 3-oxoacyl-(acyl-carrier-protein) reductase protein [Lasiodiplodia theobromae]|uniref:3-oxoacyl-(Acyl-carrier-protein) reductase protein n=1 Tax=Lasiodiplodia theobromae TaxID=45133 RepID=A0A8H7MAY6_9PEZI|nr:3-oxoacyl-(acyl-carrier-protein) reductase [Lasiodiplodia theobromae]KAF4534862.1 3-oxoacyl-(acyl-carrier-protein) reductase [Lasiodiplodia theobromae]KAF9629904.1 putative 3-oxoacyl-(acyl-carrier-protein) reductase protein [Lasiodiplodia theobromae]